jgi:ferredoxin
MVILKINNQQVEVEQGATILDAATRAGVRIPTMCFLKGYAPSTSCMVCVVEVKGRASLVPACGAVAFDGMEVVTESDEIHAARTAAIELLISDHVGDCLGPCTVGCPAKMNIPLMIRQIAAGDWAAAIATVKKDIPLPAILGRICSAPCEKVCRRKQADDAVSICLLKRFVADMDLASDKPFMPQCRPLNGKKVAVIGAGPAGLSAAYYLRQQGVDCVIYDRHEKTGGTLRYGDIDQSILSATVVDREIAQLLSVGVQFKGNIEVGRSVSIEELKSQCDAVLLAIGSKWVSEGMDWPIGSVDGKIKVSRSDYATSNPGIFAAGGCIGSRNLFIRRIADGKEAAVSIQLFLCCGEELPKPAYNHRAGQLKPDEIAVLMEHSAGRARVESEEEKGLTRVQAQQEAARCLHCDCRKPDDCRLRQMATELNAHQRTWKGEKKLFRQVTEHEQIVFEPGKCIKCGLCIQTAQTEGEQIGLSFKGRGFDAEITVPLDKSFACGLTNAAQKCVEICPTGALAMKE